MIRRFLFWSLCFACVVSIPSAAAGQSGVPVTIAWDANNDNSEGYAVFIGTQPGVYTEAVDVGPSTSFTYFNGAVGRRYYFTVAAYKPKPHLGAKAPPVSAVIEAASVVDSRTGSRQRFDGHVAMARQRAARRSSTMSLKRAAPAA